MKSKINLRKLQIGAGAVILIVLAVVVACKAMLPKEEPVEEYKYNNVTEQVLADEVIVYLQDVAGLGDTASAKTGNEAVENYRRIVRSNVDVVNDDHTQAIQERIGMALKEYAAEEDEELSREDISALSAGVAELVWQTVLSRLVTVTENADESEYIYLAESLQQQINELEDRKMKFSIRANVKNNAELTSEELFSIIEGMSDRELEDLTKSMGLSMEELNKLLESYKSDTDKEIDSRLKELETELTKELTREIKSSSVPGKDGKDGENGMTGERGEAGKNGKDGTAGKSVFVRYAENASGQNMREQPTASTKYMGTYIGVKASTNPSDYSWSKYVGNDGDNVFIRYSENANGLNMTEQPTASTKYLGTYTGAKASANPSDYFWKLYVGDDGNDGNSVFIRYSENANGLNMTEHPTASTKYMGTYIGQRASTNPYDYSWTLYVGDDGNSVFIRYAENANGLNMSEHPTETTKYIGIYTGIKASANPYDYSWTLYVGDDGNSVFIRYAENANGLNMSEHPTETTKYIGIYTGIKASTNPYDYSWTLYVGDTGADGNDGNSVFIRYAESANGMNMSEHPTEATRYMGIYTGTKASTNPSDYTWALYTGADGSDGNSVFIRYAENANGKNMTKKPDDETKYMGTYIGPKASEDPEDYTWTRYSDATISFSNGTLYITQ